MREGDVKPTLPREAAGLPVDTTRYRFRHTRITSRLFSFITTLTEEVEEANRMLQYQAEHDALTGALNRRLLDVNLGAEISRSERYGHVLSVVMFDLDHFKQFNDKYGHAAGDFILKRVVDTVRALMRGSDTLYRYGGEEFLVLLPETSVDGATDAAEKIREAIERMSLCHEDTQLPTITSSLGVACFPVHGVDGPAVLSAADAALYQAKEQGKNRVSSALCAPSTSIPKDRQDAVGGRIGREHIARRSRNQTDLSARERNERIESE